MMTPWKSKFLDYGVRHVFDVDKRVEVSRSGLEFAGKLHELPMVGVSP